MPVPPESIVFPSLHVQWGNAPLLRAAEKGHGEIVGFLLKNGSNVEEQGNVGGPKGVLSVCDCKCCMYVCCTCMRVCIRVSIYVVVCISGY